MPSLTHSASRDAQQAGELASPAMRVLTGEELRAVVGGPVINNGGGGTGLTSGDPEIKNGGGGGGPG